MGRPPCCDKANVKKGPWTPEEDAKLLAYTSNHGLKRCGKSCRLRYTNYLRPNLKHENFTQEEEDLIVTLHAMLGSRWSLIANQLPGRTDNDVKNYWNTKLSEKLKQRGIDPITHRLIADLIWSIDDEVRILEALVAHPKQHSTFPQPDALIGVLAGKLDNPAYGSKELQSKVKSLRHRYLTLSKRGEVPSMEHDRRILDLSKIVWDGDKTTTGGTNNGHEQKGFENMCKMYPYLAEEVKELEEAYPGMCKREFMKMDDDKARAMDEKIKKQRVVQIRVGMQRADLTKEVTKALMDLADG